MLQERIQAHGYGPPVYRTIATRGPGHLKTFDVEVVINDEVFGLGSGLSKQAAAKEAARAALERLELEPGETAGPSGPFPAEDDYIAPQP